MIGPADLIDFHFGLKASDLKNWKHVPASAVVLPTAEMKADLEARAAMVRQLQDESDAQRAANAALCGSTAESNQMIRTNVAALDAAGVQIEMSIVTKIIQSIASDNPFRSTAADITAAGLSYGFLITVSHRHDAQSRPLSMASVCGADREGNGSLNYSALRLLSGGGHCAHARDDREG